jgi:hypothetical protein
MKKIPHLVAIAIIASTTILSCKDEPKKVVETAKPTTVKVDTVATTTTATAAATTATTATAAATAPTTEITCYRLVENKKDISTVQLFITGNKVAGTMEWMPYEKDGARGKLSGTKVGDIINAKYDYTIEGSKQSEDMIFRLEKDGISKKEGELEEADKKHYGHLKLKDPANAKFSKKYPKVDCKK